MDKRDNYENKIDLKDTAPDISEMKELPGKTDHYTGETTPYKTKGNDCWTKDCENWEKHSWKKGVAFIGNIFEGIYQDIKYGRRCGETRAEEYWSRVWAHIHTSGGGAPDNLPNVVLREKWTILQKEGHSSDEIWAKMERQYPLAFILVPLLHRWLYIGQGGSVEKATMWEGLETYNTIMLYVLEDKKPELKDKYAEMKDQGKGEEFWREHWDQIHGVECIQAICEDKAKSQVKKKKKKDEFDWEKWFLQRRETNSFGEDIKVAPEYHKCYPFGYNIYRRIRGFIRRPDGRPIYKQFDFFS